MWATQACLALKFGTTSSVTALVFQKCFHLGVGQWLAARIESVRSKNGGEYGQEDHEKSYRMSYMIISVPVAGTSCCYGYRGNDQE